MIRRCVIIDKPASNCRRQVLDSVYSNHMTTTNETVRVGGQIWYKVAADGTRRLVRAHRTTTQVVLPIGTAIEFVGRPDRFLGRLYTNLRLVAL